MIKSQQKKKKVKSSFPSNNGGRRGQEGKWKGLFSAELERKWGKRELGRKFFRAIQ